MTYGFVHFMYNNNYYAFGIRTRAYTSRCALFRNTHALLISISIIIIILLNFDVSGLACMHQLIISGGFSHGSKGSMEPPFLASIPRHIRLCAAIRFRHHGTLPAF